MQGLKILFMSIFISYNHDTGSELALKVASKLRNNRLDPWWFPEKLHPEQVDGMVDHTLVNCNRCIFIWTQVTPSNWTFAELMSIRNYFRKRLPSEDASEAFLIIRDLGQGIGSNDTIPLFTDCQYINYNSETDLDFSFLSTGVPGVEPLTAGYFQYPKLAKDFLHDIHIGKRILHGPIIKEKNSLEFDSRYVWIMLKDKFNNLYIQQPRPTITHKGRWGSAKVHLGKDITDIILYATDSIAHKYIAESIMKQNYSGRQLSDLPGDYYELDRVSFPPLKE